MADIALWLGGCVSLATQGTHFNLLKQLFDHFALDFG
jgi:hypothetical protein